MERVQDSILTVDRIREIQEEFAGFLFREVIAPTGAYHREFIYDIRDMK
jgi:2-iminoacetate synthase ThiH